MIKLRSLFVFLLLLFVLACQNTSRKDLLPSVTGKAGQILVVMDTALWNGQVGEKIKSVFYQEYTGLPQPEPLFDLLNIHSTVFSDLFKTNRNIVFVKFNKNLEKSKITFLRNVWAAPQACVQIFVKSYKELLEILDGSESKMLSFFIEAERGRIVASYKKNLSIDIQRLLHSKYSIDMVVPRNFKVGQERDDFLWLAYETNKVSVGVLLYKYKATVPITKDYLIAQRDVVLRKYIKGPTRENSYMTTEKRFAPTMRSTTFNDNDAWELRGLWRVENDYMGGPFVSYSMLDEESQEMITVEGWVYAPNAKKREYMRQVEAILKTTALMSKNKTE